MLALRNRAAGLVLRVPELCNGGARMSTRSFGPDEWWAVDGEILRLRPDFSKGYTLVNMDEPDPRPKPLNYRKLFGDRMTRTQRIRIRDNAQEGYWEAYMERFNRTREEWEKLFWDGAPRAPDQDPVAQRPIDHYQVLGLRKRHQPYSPLELKAAFRDKAMLFHPENNREKDPKKRAANTAKFRQIWESYKNLQNKRSWVSPAFLIPVILSIFFIFIGIFTAGRYDDSLGITRLSSSTLRDNWGSAYQFTNDAGIPAPTGFYWDFEPEGPSDDRILAPAVQALIE